MMTWMELSDQYIKWWQDAASRYLNLFQDQPYFLESWGQFLDQSLQFKKMADQMVDEMWHQARLPSREDVVGLHEQLNHLDSRLAEFQDCDWTKKVGTGILEKGKVASSADLKSLQKSLKQIERRIAGASEADLVKEGVAHLEAKLAGLTEELEHLKETVVQFGSKLERLATAVTLQ
jgi:hypothetical protein